MDVRREWQQEGWLKSRANKDEIIKLLLEEYRECSADWRLRDKYVEDKFMHSVFVFTLVSTLLAAAFGAINLWRGILPEAVLALLPPIGTVLFGVLFFFVFVMLVSLVKDTYYRDGSQIMAQHLLAMLQSGLDCHCISELIEDLTVNHYIAKWEARGLLMGSPQSLVPLRFTRKINAAPGEKRKLGMPFCVEKLLVDRGTFRWITAYYGLVAFGCLAASLTSLVFWIVRP
jgi:hypothetical protein